MAFLSWLEMGGRGHGYLSNYSYKLKRNGGESRRRPKKRALGVVAINLIIILGMSWMDIIYYQLMTACFMRDAGRCP
jgi:hypothetical protein